jgi:hypothetical protein
MTYEATKVELFGANGDGQPINYTYSGTDMALKGTLLEISGCNDGRRIATRALTVYGPIAGIAASDVSGTTTNVAVLTQGVFDMYCSGTTTPGQAIVSVSQAGSENWVRGAPSIITGSAGANILGYAMRVGTTDGLTTVRLNL